MPEDSDYVGQIYRDDDKNEYSVNKLTELYGKRKPIFLSPKLILKSSKDVWGSEVDVNEIIEKAKDELV